MKGRKDGGGGRGRGGVRREGRKEGMSEGGMARERDEGGR